MQRVVRPTRLVFSRRLCSSLSISVLFVWFSLDTSYGFKPCCAGSPREREEKERRECGLMRMKRNEVLTPNPLHSILRALLKNGGALFMTLIASTRQTIFRSVKASFAAPRAGLSTKLLRAAVLLILVCVSSVASAQSLTVEWS